jgi:predicted phosphoribosyltransferase
MARPFFRDRHDAGRRVGAALSPLAGAPDLLVLALPRGGVPIGYEVAVALRAPLDLLLVRKLGVPGHEELAMGAIASGGIRVLQPPVVESLRLSERDIAIVALTEQAELERQERVFREGRPAPDLAGRTVILVDDGLATGATMRAAVLAVQARRPRRVIVAVPVGPAASCEAVRSDVDGVICLATPDPFVAVGMWYADFTAVSDDEVRDLLRRANAPAGVIGA